MVIQVEWHFITLLQFPGVPAIFLTINIYIKYRSFLLDLLILVRTVEIVFFGKGR